MVRAAEAPTGAATLTYQYLRSRSTFQKSGLFPISEAATQKIWGAVGNTTFSLSVLTAGTGIRILTYMMSIDYNSPYITLDDLTREQRVQLLLHDSTRYIRLLSDSDIDRLLANLAKRPVRPHTRDYDEMMEESRERRRRYPTKKEAREEYSDYLA